MKKGVLFIIVLFALTGFISAASICENRTVHGVEIDGECFDCGVDDGICPEDFGADCSPGGDIDCLVTEEKESWWSENPSGYPSISSSSGSPLHIDLINGKTLYLVVINTEKNEGESVSFSILEKDLPLFHDDLGTVTGSVDDTGKAIASFSVMSIDDLNEENDDENSEGEILKLFFETDDISDMGLNELYVNATLDEEEVPSDCSYYNSLGEDECNNDTEEIGGVENMRTEGDCDYISYTTCSWNGTNCLTDLGPETVDNPDICTDTRDITCSYTATSQIGDCDAGDDFFKMIYNSTQEGCEGWMSGAVPCPQQLRVPFFGVYGFITSLISITLIYIFLINKRETKQDL